jgi:hypothetical protein
MWVDGNVGALGVASWTDTQYVIHGYRLSVLNVVVGCYHSMAGSEANNRGA